MASSLLLSDTLNLKERQSGRSTFRLAAEYIDALKMLSTQLGIKQKSLFDYLMEDDKTLRTIAGKAQSEPLNRKNRIQKTFVVSKRSLYALDRISKQFDVSRDDIVAYSIQRLLPILKKEQKKQIHREAALTIIAEHFQQISEILDHMKHTLEKDDPVFQSMQTIVSEYQNAFSKIENLVEKGKGIGDVLLEKFKLE